jgi:CBS domain-containing protein
MAQECEEEISGTEKALLNASEFFDMKIKDAMDQRSWDVPIVTMDKEILDVIAIMCTNDHVWVVEDQDLKRVVGVITEHDILNALRPIKRHKFFGPPSRRGLGLGIFETAEHIMSHDPFTCTLEEKVRDVLHSMEANGVRRMPVVNPDTEEIIGEVTVHQLIRRYYNVIKPLCEICVDEEPTEKKVRRMKAKPK